MMPSLAKDFEDFAPLTRALISFLISLVTTHVNQISGIQIAIMAAILGDDDSSGHNDEMQLEKNAGLVMGVCCIQSVCIFP